MSWIRSQEVMPIAAPGAQTSFRKRTAVLRAALLLMLLVAAATVSSPAQTFKILHSFCSASSGGYCTDGQNPNTALVQGVNGDLYGTTFYGGPGNYGTIFRIASGGGKLTTIYNFCSLASCADGTQPEGGLLLAPNGNFYGVTNTGGAYGYGTVFEITAAGKLTTLHSFNQTDGAYPEAGLILATNGNFYGTTYVGGAESAGTAFEITPSGTFTSLHSFCGLGNTCSEGDGLSSGLTQATDGNFYGTAYGGGPEGGCSPYSGGGTFFQLTPSGTVTSLFMFCQPEGFYPNSAPVQVASGNFYGTTSAGGGGINMGSGTVYEMTPTGANTSLYTFCLQTACADGKDPQTLILATDGNFYGVTYNGGVNSAAGTIFKITPAGQLTTLHTFPGTSTAGANPTGALLLHTNGSFYGTTWSGGKNGSYGTFFSLATGLAPFVETIPTSGKVGSKVTILGTNLKGATAVSFNGTAATFRVVSSSEITATVPTGATSGRLTVTALAGTTLDSNVEFKIP